MTSIMRSDGFLWTIFRIFERVGKHVCQCVVRKFGFNLFIGVTENLDDRFILFYTHLFDSLLFFLSNKT